MIYIMDVYHIKGIYLLAKDLAYNVALDQTEQLTKGIHGLAKKEMYAVNQAINILDSKLEKDICKNEPYKDHKTAVGKEAIGKCGKGGSEAQTSSAKTGLSALWEDLTTNGNDSGGGYGKTSTEKMGAPHQQLYLKIRQP